MLFLHQQKQRKTVYVRLIPVDIPVVIPASIHCNEIGWLANMGYRVEVRDRQEGVRRAMVAPTITQTDPAKIVFFDREVYGLKQRVFDCERISAQVTQEQCATSYLRNNIGSGCHNCSIGRHFSGDAPIAEDRHSAINKSLGLACIRCERNEHTATRYIGRFRLVRSATLCINCFNRQREVERGYNAKGAKPVRWAHLQQATITIEDASGEWKTLDIGLRSGRAECERYVTRIHPGCIIVECFMSGEALQPGDKAPTLSALAREAGLNPATARSRMKKYGTLDGQNPSKHRTPTAAPANETEPAARLARKLKGESEWAGCAVERNGVMIGVCDYAKKRGIGDEEAAIILGMCDPDYIDEPEAAAAAEPEPAPEPVKSEPAPIPKKLTGKQLRKLEKAQRRAERQAAALAPEKPTIGKSPRAIAVTARALI
ncbi:hypothetical protein PQR21_14930 [Paraburkholderia nemoris]|uniref:hypothetical protein n=1 Tax=Paraburkholderia nemoris TaxID=2793076 RepID=UPI0038B715C4